MAATYIQPTLNDFEGVFSGVLDKRTGGRMFALVRPSGSEAYYLGELIANARGRMCIKVLTSVASGQSAARGVGEDAIRCVLYWVDSNGWECGLGKEKRVNRSTSGSVRDIVNRALERARDVARLRGSLPACPKCGRPMVIRVSRNKKVFYGCVGWAHEGCEGVSWNVPADEAAEAIARKG